MRRPGWNPIRRNRNAGTAKRGLGDRNRFGIPSGWPDDRIFWEVLREPIEVTRDLHGAKRTFLIEAPNTGCFHPAQSMTWIISSASCPPETSASSSS